MVECGRAHRGCATGDDLARVGSGPTGLRWRGSTSRRVGAPVRPTEPPSWPDEPGWLTASAAKARAYRDDVWTRESWRDAVLTTSQCEQVLRRHTYLLIKPESFATRQAGRLLHEVRRRGFSTVGAVPVTLDRQSLRILWQYQLNSAPLATLAAVDLVVAAGPTVAVVLREDGPDPDIRSSASSRLAAMKGSTHGPRHPEDLRVLLGGSVPLFSFLHVPDEPADLVRELGIWFGRAARLSLYSLLASECAEQAASAVLEDADLVVRRAEAGVDQTDLDADRMLAALLSGPASHRATARRIRTVVAQAHRAQAQPEEMRDDELVELVRVVRDLDGIAAWDRVTLAAVLVGSQRPVRAPLL